MKIIDFFWVFGIFLFLVIQWWFIFWLPCLWNVFRRYLWTLHAMRAWYLNCWTWRLTCWMRGVPRGSSRPCQRTRCWWNDGKIRIFHFVLILMSLGGMFESWLVNHKLWSSYWLYFMVLAVIIKWILNLSC